MAIELSCLQFEEAMSDYIEGVVPPDMAAAMRWHAHRCSACAELLEGVREAVAVLAELPEMDLPPGFEAAVLRRIRASREAAGWSAALRSLWHGLLQPKVALGFSMAVFAFALIISAAGIHLNHVRVADLSPSRVSVTVRRQFNRTVARGVAYYNDLRVVYEIQAALHEMRQGEASRPPRPGDRSEQNRRNPPFAENSPAVTVAALFFWPASHEGARLHSFDPDRRADVREFAAEGNRRSVKEI